MNNEEVDHYEGSACETIDKLTAKLDKATKCIKAVISWTNGSTLDMSVQKRCKQTLAELKGETNE